ncbi:bumetanide-sensitive sodium-(potassium)-chloride cotransporter-like [Adelges cooleyi]|uniref:bumetanide-sensitive sodium-(potassium)-chloride cotransporter-like n=1 Tax=Adelges cooleyi TaxID=133065 RepID=UPI0021805D8B|nr:bumetanide-sensitive sodium-(potassium)-chloride cotransporter-like [Adelges cooleyi]XP_050443367.1 bumetanide-sensitive sodium-(potassium)-chloride cotransporter-like [Adelges cooleyi]
MDGQGEMEFIKYHDTQWINQIQSYDRLVREEEEKLDVGHGVKLGWIKGVLIPCLLSIWGVMLFLRLPWIVGQAGIRDSIIIILISTVIILITTTSLSAISTNGRIKGGGLYFIISRSIGPEFGSSIGVLLALANTISAAMNTIGFCMSLKLLLQWYDLHNIMDTEHGYKIIGVVLIILMGITCAIGMDREAEVQNVLLVVIVMGIFDVIVGSAMGPSDDQARASGFTGLKNATFIENWHPDYRHQQSFFSVFAVFFPSVTGIQAGANISGDLKDPSASIPKGTLLSIAITITSYIALVFVSGGAQLREASGNFTELIDGSYSNCSYRTCQYGLYHDDQLMQSISVWPIFIYFGTFGATISTALTALIAVPKILQRMGQDQVYPLLKYLAKGYGPANEPYRAHLFAIAVSSTFFVIGELNAIASFISTIYLCSYAMLNLCTFHVAHYNHLGWRPTYKFFNKWLSLAGSVICFGVMISIDMAMSVTVFCAIWALHTMAARRKNDINWGSSMKIQRYKTILKNVQNVYAIKYHVKNYLPNVIVLSGMPDSRKALVSLGHLITKETGLLICVNVEKDKLTHDQRQSLLDEGIGWLKKSRLSCLFNVMDSVSVDAAVRMIYMCGHGQLRPNIILVGYKSDWSSCSEEELRSYLNIFNEASMNEMSTLIIRSDGPLSNEFFHCKTQRLLEILPSKIKPAESSVNVSINRLLFTRKRTGGTVDVWWLFDDKGLSLTIAYVLMSSTFWKNCTFRIFGVASAMDRLSTEKNKLKKLMTMFRVNFDCVDIIVASNASPLTMAYFNSLTRQMKETHPNELKMSKDNASKTLFLRDLIEVHSTGSSLIILSIPKPIREFNKIHMCWIETITRELPPCILIHGNKIPTVTAYA